MTIESMLVRPSRRIKRLIITPELILELLKLDEGGSVISGRLIQFVADPIPSSATAHRAGIMEDGTVQLIVEDESFALVPEGGLISELQPMYGQTSLPEPVISELKALREEIYKLRHISD